MAEQQSDRSEQYRLELEGELAEEWRGWFGADHIATQRGRTVMLLTVPDQAALHGVLRRVHDLHLRLVSLTRCDVNNDRGVAEPAR